MRTTAIIVISLMMNLFTGDVLAKTSPKKRQISVVVERSLSKESNVLTQENKKWSCKTELLPFVEIEKEPKSMMAYKKLKVLNLIKFKKIAGNCSDRITISDSLSKGKIKQFCMVDPGAKEFINLLAKDCGR